MIEDRLLRDATFVAFDTETTGLKPVAASLLEIGAVKFRLDGASADTFDMLIDPGRPVPEEASNIHGITDDLLRGKPTAEEVLPRFIEFLGPPDNVLLAHNALFDVGFIVLDLYRARLPVPGHKIFDTVALARALIPYLPGYSLQGLCAALEIAPSQEHRALADARLVEGLFLALLDRAEGLRTVGDLAALCPPVTFLDAGVNKVEAPPGFEALDAALEESRAVEIIYAGGTRGLEPRRVTPRAIVQINGLVYLAAYSHADGRNKMYRLTRIRSFKVHT